LFAPAGVAALAGAAVQPSLPPLAQGADDFELVSGLELGHYMRNTLLRDTDATSMSLGLEVRVPFVDRRVVESVRGVPAAFHADGSRPKPLLLDALGSLIPEFVWRRPKQGFLLPVERWMRGRLRPEIEAVLGDAVRLRDLGLDPAATLAVWHRFLRHPGWVGWTRPWSLFVLARWAERHGLRA
jgi:asparagine synthase (glutamine-hydrolysing)